MTTFELTVLAQKRAQVARFRHIEIDSTSQLHITFVFRVRILSMFPVACLSSCSLAFVKLFEGSYRRWYEVLKILKLCKQLELLYLCITLVDWALV